MTLWNEFRHLGSGILAFKFVETDHLLCWMKYIYVPVKYHAVIGMLE